MYIWPTLLKSAGLSGFFASRAFLSAFSFALLARFGDNIPLLRDNWMVQSLSSAPEWFTHDYSLIILGTLGVLELLSDKIPEVRDFMSTFDSYFKATVATIISMGLLGESDTEFIRPLVESGVGALLPALVVGAVVYGLASARSQFLALLRDSDSEDSFGIQSLISWAEDIWTTFGPLIFILFPVTMSVLMAAAFGLIALWARRRETREERLKLNCQSCDNRIMRHSLECPQCHAENPTVHRVSVFGFSRNKVVEDRDEHAIELVQAGRCPSCADRIDGRSVPVHCDVCSKPIFSDPAILDRFMASQRSRMKIGIPVCALFSLIPVVGLIPGVIFYRLYMVAPFRRYLPASNTFLLRWGIRALFFILIALQWIPAVGGIVVPTMAWVSFESYRAAFLSRFRPGDRAEDRTPPGTVAAAT